MSDKTKLEVTLDTYQIFEILKDYIRIKLNLASTVKMEADYKTIYTDYAERQEIIGVTISFEV